MSSDRWEGFVAMTLAVGVALAVNLVTAGVLYDAIFSEGPGLSDNATQLLTTAFGGIIGVLGAYVGFRAGTERSAGDILDERTEPEIVAGRHDVETLRDEAGEDEREDYDGDDLHS